MRYRIEIECDNAAFGETKREQAAEIARILVVLCTDIQNAPARLNENGVRLMDINGNRVGYAYVERK